MVIFLLCHLDIEIAVLEGFSDKIVILTMFLIGVLIRSSPFGQQRRFGSKTCPVYAEMPYISDVSCRLEGQIHRAMNSCQGTIDFHCMLDNF